MSMPFCLPMTRTLIACAEENRQGVIYNLGICCIINE
jgi:hypothetical protein